MEAFHWIVVPISTVLGLAIARILLAYVNVFKARESVRFDWLPMVIACIVLAEGWQFWWALLELSNRGSWTLAAYSLLIAMVMALFTAAAIVAPADSDRDLRRAFARDGRWALIALACFHLLALAGNLWLFHTPIGSLTELLLVVLVALCVFGALTPRRRWQEAAVGAYVLLGVADVVIASNAY